MRSKANLVWRSVDVSRPGCVGLALRERLTEAPATYLNVCKAVVIALALLWASCAKDNEVGIVAATSDSGALDTSEASGAAPSDVTARSCRLEADGSCSPLTAETTCLPFTGRLYDEVGSCVTSAMTTLYCAAFASNGPGGFAEATGCYIENGAGGSVIYWTPSRDLGSVQATDHACDQSVSGRVVAAPQCGSNADVAVTMGVVSDGGIARSCRLEADGSCSPLTAETTCLPFTGRLYDEVGSCVTSAMTTLYCAAFASNGPGGFAEATGCYIENGDGGSVIYWTPSRDLGSVQATDHACDQSVSGRVVAAPQCGYSVGLGPTP